MLKRRVTFANYQSGFTLIEVLVAIIILAIGLLGLANLQIVSLRNNMSAYLRTQAIVLAHDIMERMRSNVQYYNTNPIPNPISHGCLKNQCTLQQIAENDLFEWNAAIRAVLPGGMGTPPTPGATINGVTTYVITIQWVEPAPNGRQVLTMNFQI